MRGPLLGMGDDAMLDPCSLNYFSANYQSFVGLPEILGSVWFDYIRERGWLS